MDINQILRIDRIFNDSIYLLDVNSVDNKYIFEISGTTNNIYRVQIHLNTGKIYCNCPDALGWCKKNNILCKHCCFIIIKVLKLPDYKVFFETKILKENQIEFLKKNIKNLNLNSENTFVNTKLLDRYNEIKNDNNSKQIDIQKNNESICVICYSELENLEKSDSHLKYKQCKCCFKIIHKKCLQKWIDIGKNTCPYCRNFITLEKNGKYKNLFS